MYFLNGCLSDGTFPKKAAKKVPIAVARQVTVIRVPLSIPTIDRIAGVTKII